MARDSSGVYTNALPDVVSGDVIEAAWANTTIDDIGAEIQDSLSRSGKGNMSAALKVIAGSVSAPGLSFASEANSGFYRASAGDIRMALNSAEAWRVTSAGFRVPADITLAAGNIIPSTAGKGIDFAAQTATAATGATTTAEIFGHYEEGTWTPNLWDSSNSSSESQAYNSQSGTYTRIGRQVHCVGSMILTSIGTLTGSDACRIGPLPFQCGAGQFGFGRVYSSTALGYALVQISFASGNSYATVDQITGSAGDYSSLTLTELSLLGLVFGIEFNIFYTV